MDNYFTQMEEILKFDQFFCILKNVIHFCMMVDLYFEALVNLFSEGLYGAV